MNTKEHKKIGRQKKRMNKLSRDLQLLGYLLMGFSVVFDLIAMKLAWQYQPWYGFRQAGLFAIGVAFWIIGWRIRR